MNREARRLIGLISVAMAIETAAYGTITPLLPKLAGDYGLTKAGAGVLSGSYPVGTLAFSLPAGALAARLGAQRTVLAALATLAGASLLFAVADSATILIVARALQGAAGATVWAGGLAWVVAVAPVEQRGQAIGAAIGAAIAGALGGPILGAAAAAFGRGVVLSVFVLAPGALIFALARLRGPRTVPTPGLAALRILITDASMRRGAALMALPACAFGMLNVLVPLRLDELGAAAGVIAAVFLIAVPLEAVMSPLAGRMADRRGPLVPAGLGLLSGGTATALLPLPATVVVLGAVTVAAASLFGMLWTPAMSLLSSAADERGMNPAFAFGLGNLAWGAGTALGGSGGGALASVTADAVPYLLLAGAAIATAASLRLSAPPPGRRSGSRTSSTPRSSASARSPVP